MSCTLTVKTEDGRKTYLRMREANYWVATPKLTNVGGYKVPDDSLSTFLHRICAGMSIEQAHDELLNDLSVRIDKIRIDLNRTKDELGR